MGFSPLADMSRRISPGGRQSARNSRIRGFTIHHQAGVDAHGQATAAGREVSANYWITNSGVIIPNVDETMRAWTTGAAGYPGGAESDHRNITVEVSNSPEGVRTGSWAISSAARRALVALIGDVFRRHKLGTVKRGTHGGVAVHQDFVPTACPGPYIMRNLGSIINDAEKARRGTSPSNSATKPVAPTFGGTKMMIRNKGRYAVFGPGFWLEFTGKHAASELLKQISGGGKGVRALEVSDAFWSHCKKASGK